MLDPMIGLSTSVAASPGVYALLLGSGVSTSAGIPTGWQVVTDLIGRCAAASASAGEEVPAAEAIDPEEWWGEHGDSTPLGYSSLLAALAPTPAARHSLLAGYFEPTQEDLDNELKVPGPAHKAVARLVARGAVRVILTTNFDRLIERALEEEGIAPQVVHRPEHLDGATPLAHARATVIKLHGDYADLDKRNTIDELSAYPAEYDRYLDRVFDEYGLIVSGWSGDWDRALVAALERCRSRRYPMYWSAYGDPSERARRTIAQHGAVVVRGVTADEFFGDLVTRLESLDSLSSPALTRDLAIVQLKRTLPNPARRIEVFDLIDAEVNRVVEKVSDSDVYPTSVADRLIYAEFQRWLEGMRADVDTILHLLATGVFHDDGSCDDIWLRALTRLMTCRSQISNTFTSGLDSYRHYPALLGLSVAGVSAVLAGREDLLARLLLLPKWRPWVDDTTPQSAVVALHPYMVLEGEWVNQLPRWENTRWIYPNAAYLG